MRATLQPRAAGLSALPTRDDGGSRLSVIEATQSTRHNFKYTPRATCSFSPAFCHSASASPTTSAFCRPPGEVEPTFAGGTH